MKHFKLVDELKQMALAKMHGSYTKRIQTYVGRGTIPVEMWSVSDSVSDRVWDDFR